MLFLGEYEEVEVEEGECEPEQQHPLHKALQIAVAQKVPETINHNEA